jgi:nicotinamidase-related amidase
MNLAERWPKPFAPNPRSAALVVVDMQNDFVRVGAPIEVPAARETIEQHQRLLAWFRDHGQPVVFTRAIQGPATPLTLLWHPECGPPVCACWPGVMRVYGDIAGERDCAAVIDELVPSPGDLIVEKYGYNAFHRTILTNALLSHGVDTVVITGTVTQLCVEDTARGAYHEGFKPVLVADAVSSNDPDQHRCTLNKLAQHFARVMATDELLDQFERSL